MNRRISFLTPVKVLMVIGLVYFMVSLQQGTEDSQASVEAVAQSVTAAIDMEAMQEGSNRMLKKLYGLNAGDYEGVMLYMPVTNMDAEEILIVKLKDQSQAESVTAAIHARLETQKTSFEGYGIEQFALLEKHVLDVQGNFIFYGVHEDVSKADAAFQDAL